MLETSLRISIKVGRHIGIECKSSYRPVVKWLVPLTPDRVVWVRAADGITVLCPCTKRFTLTVSLRVKKSLYTSQVAPIRPALIHDFCSMKRLKGVFDPTSPPPNGMLVHCGVAPNIKFACARSGERHCESKVSPRQS